MLGGTGGAPHHSSLKQLQQECQQLQVSVGGCDILSTLPLSITTNSFDNILHFTCK